MKPRVRYSNLTGRAYALTRYTESDDGALTAQTKHDVTDDVVHDLMATAWARGWNECNAAAEGEAPPNPYRLTATDTAPVPVPEGGQGLAEVLAEAIEDEVRRHGAPATVNEQARAGWILGMARAAHIARTHPAVLVAAGLATPPPGAAS